MNLEDLAVMRAEEQLALGEWRQQDSDEPAYIPRDCMRCDAPLHPRRAWARLCKECSKAGYRPRRCVSCDRVLHRRDLYITTHVGYCAWCRAEFGLESSTGADPEEVNESLRAQRRALLY